MVIRFGFSELFVAPKRRWTTCRARCAKTASVRIKRRRDARQHNWSAAWGSIAGIAACICGKPGDALRPDGGHPAHGRDHRCDRDSSKTGGHLRCTPYLSLSLSQDRPLCTSEYPPSHHCFGVCLILSLCLSLCLSLSLRSLSLSPLSLPSLHRAPCARARARRQGGVLRAIIYAIIFYYYDDDSSSSYYYSCYSSSSSSYVHYYCVCMYLSLSLYIYIYIYVYNNQQTNWLQT